MKFFNLIPYYFAWHYSKSLVAFVFLLSDMLSFICNFFSIRALFVNLFSPRKKLSEKDTTDLPEKESKVSVVAGMFSMFFLRSIVILAGIVSWFAVLIIGIVSFFIWFFLPFILLCIFIVAVASLFKVQSIGDLELSFFQSNFEWLISKVDYLKILIS